LGDRVANPDEVVLEQKGKQPGSPVQRDGIHYYPPGPVARSFLKDDSFVCGMMGPFGSGKSTAVVMKLIKNMQGQKRSADGWLRRRTAIIRNTYPELRTTTMNTWFQWMPKHVGKWREAGPPLHHIVDQEKKIDWEVYFVALDRPDDLAKLLGMELSDAWVNEAREVAKAVIDGLMGRVGRYPALWQGGATDVQILMDTNPPDTDHWWYVLAEMDRSNEKNNQIIASMLEAQEVLRTQAVLLRDQSIMRFYKQPGGRSPGAENLRNLRAGYYEFLAAGKDLDFIKVYVDGEYGFVMDGMPIYPEYKDSVHAGDFPVLGHLGFRIGCDWGLTPAASISQRLGNGRWLTHDELVSERMGIGPFAHELARKLQSDYPGVKLVSVRGDPSGDAVTPDETTCFKIMQANGFPTCVPAPTNDPVRRKEGMKFMLRTMIDGNPMWQVNKRCYVMRKGMAGGYNRRRLQVTGEVRYRDVPDKNKYSHVIEALEYDIVSGGEDRHVTVGPADKRQPRKQFAETDYNEFGG
jgi:hypothetical protein